jgi:hypothetical protein
MSNKSISVSIYRDPRTGLLSVDKAATARRFRAIVAAQANGENTRAIEPMTLSERSPPGRFVDATDNVMPPRDGAVSVRRPAKSAAKSNAPKKNPSKKAATKNITPRTAATKRQR